MEMAVDAITAFSGFIQNMSNSVIKLHLPKSLQKFLYNVTFLVKVWLSKTNFGSMMQL